VRTSLLLETITYWICPGDYSRSRSDEPWVVLDGRPRSESPELVTILRSPFQCPYRTDSPARIEAAWACFHRVQFIAVVYPAFQPIRTLFSPFLPPLPAIPFLSFLFSTLPQNLAGDLGSHVSSSSVRAKPRRKTYMGAFWLNFWHLTINYMLMQKRYISFVDATVHIIPRKTLIKIFAHPPRNSWPTAPLGTPLLSTYFNGTKQ